MNNPILEGIRINPGLDLFATSFTDTELADVYYGLSADAEDEALLMETATPEEIDAEYNPGEPEMLLEAVTVRKFSQTKRRMAALTRALNKNFDGIKADPAQIGKVRKSGIFASVTVQIPLSDGQVISIVFHSPDNDNTRIAPDDEIIAFRWLLNKRDITQAVSPESGRDVSLEQISKRITQIASKNSEKFQQRSKQVGEQKTALRTAKADLAMVDAARDDLLMEIRANEEDVQDIGDQISNAQELLDAAIAFNASLQEQIDNLKAAQADQEAEKAEIRKLEKEAIRFGMNSQNLEALKLQGVDAFRKAVQRLQEEDAAIEALEPEPTPEPTPEPEPEKETPAPEPPEAIQTLNNIINGDLDDDPDAIDRALDLAADELEDAGLIDEYDDLLNEAADHYTVVLEQLKEAA